MSAERRCTRFQRYATLALQRLFLDVRVCRFARKAPMRFNECEKQDDATGDSRGSRAGFVGSGRSESSAGVREAG